MEATSSSFSAQTQHMPGRVMASLQNRLPIWADWIVADWIVADWIVAVVVAVVVEVVAEVVVAIVFLNVNVTDPLRGAGLSAGPASPGIIENAQAISHGALIIDGLLFTAVGQTVPLGRPLRCSRPPAPLSRRTPTAHARAQTERLESVTSAG